MREISVKLDDRKKVPVWIAGCVHVGALTHLGGLLDKWISWAKRANPYIILAGDMIESALPGHRFSQGVWLQTINPHEQIEKVIELFKDLNVVAVLRGNHERRIYNISSVDPAKLIADGLGARYMGFGGKFSFTFDPGVSYRGVVFHGSGGSTNPKTQLDKASKIYHGFDFIAISHLHKLYEDAVQEMTPHGVQTTYRIRCGSFLGYEEYAEEAFYEPGISGSPLLYLYREERLLSVNISGFPSKF